MRINRSVSNVLPYLLQRERYLRNVPLEEHHNTTCIPPLAIRATRSANLITLDLIIPITLGEEYEL
jgi:hypothetical protein